MEKTTIISLQRTITSAALGYAMADFLNAQNDTQFDGFDEIGEALSWFSAILNKINDELEKNNNFNGELKGNKNGFYIYDNQGNLIDEYLYGKELDYNELLHPGKKHFDGLMDELNGQFHAAASAAPVRVDPIVFDLNGYELDSRNQGQ